MMKTKGLKLVASILLVLLFLSLVVLAQGKSNSFIIERADDSTTLSLVGSSELESLISTVDRRIVVEYANELQYNDLSPIPAELRNMLSQISERFVIEYANANRFYSIDYPRELIGDKQPPQVSTPDVNPVTAGSVQITWTTNEFTKGKAKYGTKSGQYTKEKTEEQYTKQHKIVLAGLAEDTIYFYQLSNTDRSKNVTHEQERSFTVVANRLIYLPSVLRN